MIGCVQEYTKLVDRVRGSLLGGAIGDALGWPIEFYELDKIRDAHGPDGVTDFLPGRVADAPQQITDDTQMTLFTAEGLLRLVPGTDPAPALRRAYLRWFRTQKQEEPDPAPDGWLAGRPFLYARRGPGSACMSGLTRQQEQYREPHQLGVPGPVNPDSKGCGTVMRSAPFGLARLGPDVAFTMAARCAQLTHGHPTGYLAAGVFAALIDRVVAGIPLRDAVQQSIIQITGGPHAEETVAALHRAVEVADEDEVTAEQVQKVGAGWIAEECLAVAVYCALVADRTADPRAALLLSVNHSGDSDSTGAVAGNLIGAAHGLSALPLEWAGKVEGRDELIQVADDLILAFHVGDRNHLPARYPLDVPVH
ncbi:ADP-ribosylglycohydrolase family protein [Nocardia macrotermitis]|uniref:ADP-ribosyl-[dinitrogen reductase] glycohydrolase n=1 Tax=Nocardia macrotermitis TaxID=2585198 RepID=A0A7K0D1Q8_9NOCA|nr:ADP-ribosylglycohydrolase family protein [Nocardia macrotermitis]MQY19650.1 ADP-ribosyl-[dinitrogen reductase] glycohydrolase [Nocardia macrotermitis]